MIQILVLVILIALNAFFAATEMAFVSINDAKVEISIGGELITKHLEVYKAYGVLVSEEGMNTLYSKGNVQKYYIK